MSALRALLALACAVVTGRPTRGEPRQMRTAKPVLHGRHWVAITGRPLAAATGALNFVRGGNAIDARLRHARRHLHDVGRLEPPRRGLRHRVVGPKRSEVASCRTCA